MNRYEHCGITHSYNINNLTVCQLNLKDIIRYDTTPERNGLIVSHKTQILNRINQAITDYYYISSKINPGIIIKYLIGSEYAINKLISEVSNNFVEAKSIFGIKFLKLDINEDSLYFISDKKDIDILLENNIIRLN